jgi:protoheme IX farnesyltransferase
MSRALPLSAAETRLTTATTSTIATPPAPTEILRVAAWRQWAADYAALLKLRITLMVVITAWAGFYLGCARSGISSWNMDLLHALLGVALTSCGAGALNQVLERVYDARMSRTAKRPMPTGRIGLVHGLLVGMACVAAGTLLLAYYNNLLTSTLALLTVFLYVAIYTPLKRFTTLATFIGAFPGAIPPVLGWTAARGVIEWPAVALFAILFVWQFPHFMAIAWLYRRDYAKAGIRMLPVVESDGKSTVRQALIYAVLMVPVSLAPFWLHMTGWIYLVAAAVLGIGYLAATIRFGKILRATSESESRGYARTLLKVSVLYLPLLLGCMMADAIARPVL